MISGAVERNAPASANIVGTVGVIISFPPIWPTGNLFLISFCERAIFVSFIPSTSRILSLTNCERLYSGTIVGKSNYQAGKKYCRRCEIYLFLDGVFCPCCGMPLRTPPTSKRDKERLSQLKFRKEEQDRIIRNKE